MSPGTPATGGRRRHRQTGTRNLSADARTLIALNAAGAAAASAFAAFGAVRPGYIDRENSPSASAGFWAASSAVRTWAIAIPLLAALVRQGRRSPELLAVAGLVQLGDSALGIRRHNPGMTIAPALMGIVHLATAWRLAHPTTPDDPSGDAA